MKVVALSETYAPDMGYLTTMLPRAWRGPVRTCISSCSTWLRTTTCRISSRPTASFLRDTPVAGSVQDVDGYRSTYSGTTDSSASRGPVGLQRKLRGAAARRRVHVGGRRLAAAAGGVQPRARLGFRLFTGSHTAAIMFPLARMRRAVPADAAGLRSILTRWLPGRLVSWVTELCYAPTSDCGEIAWRFFGVQRHKVRVVHLGVDTDVFHPLQDDHERAERAATRSQLGFDPQESSACTPAR